MGYPTSVQSFTNKSNGQTIDASHINDPQTEITAIETALLGTITHSLNVSGASTVATLQVTGGSTFNVRIAQPPPEAAVVFLQDAYALSSAGTPSTLSWKSEQVLINSSIHSTTTNPERLTPQTTGLFQFTAQLAFTPNSSGDRTAIIVDSSGNSLAAVRSPHTGGVNGPFINVTGYKRYDAVGGYARCLVDFSSASTLTVSTGVAFSFFSMVKL